jgi:NAD(P)-dependent dehydrogenase (short-subunit alcohol dehydrogenase family)
VKDFKGKLAVVTGGGTGMGRELVCQLVSEGAHVAMCDISESNMQETARLAKPGEGIRITSHFCDVSVESDMNRFKEEVVSEHGADHINLLFNNAGVSLAGDFVNIDRALWEKTFGVCWYGVYYGCLAFMPLLVASKEGHVINTSSINGFWASVGPLTSHTAYSAAKFAVKGFTEALITDLRLNAPHVKASLVMPGHVGTSIALNSQSQAIDGGAMGMSKEAVDQARIRLERAGVPVSNLTDDHIREMTHQNAVDFRDNAPTSAGQAAKTILDGVKAEKWRILVGDDAHVVDQLVRESPEDAYGPEFLTKLRENSTLDVFTKTE